MRIFELSAVGWETEIDFYRAVYDAIEAPKNASCNVNALLDYIVWGDMGALEPPYTFRVSGLDEALSDVVEEVQYIKGAVLKARTEFNQRKGHDVDVSIEIVS